LRRLIEEIREDEDEEVEGGGGGKGRSLFWEEVRAAHRLGQLRHALPPPLLPFFIS
jgi:hypothetical protein